MAMTGAGLKTAILDSIAGYADGERTHDAMWEAIAQAIVDYIKANAVVTGPVNVTSVSGVTTGGGTSGAGTGNLTNGTIA